MSMELKSNQSVQKNIRRIAKKLVEKTLEDLAESSKKSRDRAVHDARKGLKKLRACLRLVRPEAGERIYREENRRYRDAARPLTEVRDAKILVESLGSLQEHFEKQIAGRAFHDTREALQKNLRQVRSRVLDHEEAFAVARSTVQQGSAVLKHWTKLPDKWRSSAMASVRSIARPAARIAPPCKTHRMRICTNGGSRPNISAISCRSWLRSGRIA